MTDTTVPELPAAMVERAARALAAADDLSHDAVATLAPEVAATLRAAYIAAARSALTAALTGCEVTALHRVTYGSPVDVPDLGRRSSSAWCAWTAAEVLSAARGYRDPVVERRLRILTEPEPGPTTL